ncbi:type IV pilus assembly protein PilQ [Chiayiivirga flava]|uniref:Type IV pilus assembly protein PilQ n=2 Tax=Chiayiivirga flava TaxID=659595 RepID=A0A7W8DA07_9GAMM|nr:type IV pilus assembly protein PilQ [Chiayiivirga flava]
MKAKLPTFGQGLKRRMTRAIGLFALAVSLPAAAQNVLEEISYAPGADGSVQITLHMAQPVQGAQAFTTDEPPRIAIDLPGTTNRVSERRIAIGNGATSAVSAVEASGRTRVIVDLFRSASYETRGEGSNFIITVAPGAGMAAQTGVTPGLAADPAKRIGGGAAISNVDFRRTAEGAGRVVLTFDGEGAVADMRTEGQAVVVDLPGVRLPESLRQKLDVIDFATPVQTVESNVRGVDTRVTLMNSGAFETLAYQTGNEYVVEVSPIAPEDAAVAGSLTGDIEKGYVGKPVTFNFQDIPVRTVLQLIAEESELNIVAADSVTGNVTLRLINVPWDQALDIVLRAKSLDQRRDGSVIWIAPQAEIAAYEQAKADARIANEERAELVAEYIAINYGSAEDIAKLLTDESKTAQQGGGGGQGGTGQQSRGFLSPRGSVSFDRRTNTLLVNDSIEKINEIKALIALLDRPVDQVLIESRIVIATEDFARELGAQFGISGGYEDSNGNIITTGGGLNANNTMINSALVNRFNGSSTGLPVGRPGPVGGGVLVPSLTDRLNVSMPVVNPAGRLGFAVLGADYLLDLELSALETEGRGEVVSSPRVITANQREAVISQGDEIGYITVTPSAGATPIPTVQFKEALLELKVTPTITQDGRVFLAMNVKKDEVSGILQSELGDIPTLAKRQISTAVLVENGQTVVIGGVYEFTSREDLRKVPFLADVPILGNLFRNKQRESSKAELLIFVTPKVLPVAGRR